MNVISRFNNNYKHILRITIAMQRALFIQNVKKDGEHELFTGILVPRGG